MSLSFILFYIKIRPSRTDKIPNSYLYSAGNVVEAKYLWCLYLGFSGVEHFVYGLLCTTNVCRQKSANSLWKYPWWSQPGDQFFFLLIVVCKVYKNILVNCSFIYHKSWWIGLGMNDYLVKNYYKNDQGFNCDKNSWYLYSFYDNSFS